ncbi:hypothetical protein [Paenibacillus macerans]|uniref:hypothetical protein n=1 Tax=Paenibacillus macerans TaxID=44252 RepID=UPI00203BCB2D|nr:hypothetical protein [Paenibacillus macerans]MCM3701328.1 hypothetical protein [Paenibacillus macerans]
MSRVASLAEGREFSLSLTADGLVCKIGGEHAVTLPLAPAAERERAGRALLRLLQEQPRALAALLERGAAGIATLLPERPPWREAAEGAGSDGNGGGGGSSDGEGDSGGNGRGNGDSGDGGGSSSGDDGGGSGSGSGSSDGGRGSSGGVGSSGRGRGDSGGSGEGNGDSGGSGSSSEGSSGGDSGGSISGGGVRCACGAPGCVRAAEAIAAAEAAWARDAALRLKALGWAPEALAGAVLAAWAAAAPLPDPEAALRQAAGPREGERRASGPGGGGAALAEWLAEAAEQGRLHEPGPEFHDLGVELGRPDAAGEPPGGPDPAPWAALLPGVPGAAQGLALVAAQVRQRAERLAAPLRGKPR